MSTYTIPNVISRTPQGDRVMDVYSRLLDDRIVYLGTEIDDGVANALIAQILHLDSDNPEAPIDLYINSPGGLCDGNIRPVRHHASTATPHRDDLCGPNPFDDGHCCWPPAPRPPFGPPPRPASCCISRPVRTGTIPDLILPKRSRDPRGDRTARSRHTARTSPPCAATPTATASCAPEIVDYGTPTRSSTRAGGR